MLSKFFHFFFRFFSIYFKPYRTSDELQKILRYPTTRQLDDNEKNLVWNHRSFLKSKTRELPKILKSINWDSVSEVNEATKILESWPALEVEDALELFGKNFKNSVVHSFAVKFLKNIQYDEFDYYLPQLVQALKYEIVEKPNNLGKFLFHHASLRFKSANTFYWLLSIEKEQEESSSKNDNEQYFSTTRNEFLKLLELGSKVQNSWNIIFQKQDKFLKVLKYNVDSVMDKKDDWFEKETKLKNLLSQIEHFEPFPHPLHPEVVVKGIVPTKISLFKSSLLPIKMTFVTENDQELETIFKHSKVRQDQLLLQLFELMNKLLLQVDLDLKLTPYKVLAVSTNHGFVEHLNSSSVADILEVDGSIENFFKKQNTMEFDKIIDNYIRSCAGYSIIGYILGIGDRHFDNMLLTKEGKLIQIDFTYVFGRTTTPLPIPIKLTHEMVDAMGGLDSENFKVFQEYCFKAFLELRKHSNLILNLMNFMVNSETNVDNNAIAVVEKNFHMDLSDEEATEKIQEIIMQSTTAVMPMLMDLVFNNRNFS